MKGKSALRVVLPKIARFPNSRGFATAVKFGHKNGRNGGSRSRKPVGFKSEAGI